MIRYVAIAVLVALPVCAGIITRHGPRESDVSVTQIPRVSYVRGTSARVVLIAFLDFDCKYCARFAREMLPIVDERYVRTGKVTYAFRYLPLRVHPFAYDEAHGAACAERQGLFWRFQDRLFGLPGTASSQGDLVRNAGLIGIDTNRFQHCLEEDQATVVDKDIAEAQRLHISATPTFLLGARQRERVLILERITGIRPLEQFTKSIDLTIARVSGGEP